MCHNTCEHVGRSVISLKGSLGNTVHDLLPIVCYQSSNLIMQYVYMICFCSKTQCLTVLSVPHLRFLHSKNVLLEIAP